MDLVEFNTHSFVIKVWREEPGDDQEEGEWRGHITHIPSGERRYLKSLNGIVAFIVPYLASMGVRLNAFWKLSSWLGGDAGGRASKTERALHVEE